MLIVCVCVCVCVVGVVDVDCVCVCVWLMLIVCVCVVGVVDVDCVCQETLSLSLSQCVIGSLPLLHGCGVSAVKREPQLFLMMIALVFQCVG